MEKERGQRPELLPHPTPCRTLRHCFPRPQQQHHPNSHHFEMHWCVPLSLPRERLCEVAAPAAAARPEASPSASSFAPCPARCREMPSLRSCMKLHHPLHHQCHACPSDLQSLCLVNRATIQLPRAPQHQNRPSRACPEAAPSSSVAECFSGSFLLRAPTSVDVSNPPAAE